jgi:hypothetical protein
MATQQVISAMHEANNDVEMKEVVKDGRSSVFRGTSEAKVCDLLSEDGFPETTIAKVRESELTFDELGKLDNYHWTRLGLSLAAEIRLKHWYEEKTALDVNDFPEFPASLTANLKSHFFALCLMGPILAIGLLSDIDKDDPPSIHDYDIQMERVGIPGICILIVLYLITMAIRTQLGMDMIEEKSHGVDVGSSQSSVLANSGLVCALFLTIVIAMVQADAPVLDDGGEGRMICQYYMLFNIFALFLCFLGSMMSSMLLQYISPLDESASYVYFTNFIDYFGEPACCIMVAILMFVYATTCWIFGRYGKVAGIVCTLAMDLCMQRIILTQMYISSWSNPFISEEHRKVNKTTKN